jgi:hypothetical protein
MPATGTRSFVFQKKKKKKGAGKYRRRSCLSQRETKASERSEIIAKGSLPVLPRPIFFWEAPASCNTMI